MQNLTGKIWSRVINAIKTAPEEEPWDGYYMVRGLDAENIMRFARLKSLGDTLDIGCGNGFTSYLISPDADSIIGADLYSENPRTHSMSLDNARRLFSKLGIRKIPLCACSIEEMPFKDESFDTVIASNVLHYLKDKRTTLSELKRVVRKNGSVILVLPNFLERIYSFLQFYIYLAIKVSSAWGRLFKYSPRGKDAGGTGIVQRIEKFKQDYKYFPFPGPHGAYKNSAIEMIRHIPFCWNREFRKNNFKVNRSFTTTFVSYPLLLTFSLKASSIFFAILKPFTQYFGDKAVMKYFGNNYCVVLKK